MENQFNQERNKFVNDRISQKYNELYESSEEIIFDAGKPTEFVDQISNFVKNGKVLDIGGGDGRNALYLAERGYDVEVVDLAQAGLDKLKKFADERGLQIKTKAGDIMQEKINGTYEVLVSSFMMQHLSRFEAETLIKEMKDHTAPGGVNVLAVFTKEGDFYNSDPTTKCFYPVLGELKEMYSDWEVKDYKEIEDTANQKNKDGTHTRNINAFLIAQKLF